MFDVLKILYNVFPKSKSYPKFLVYTVVYFLKKIFHEKQINEILNKTKNQDSFEFVQNVIRYFNITYKADEKQCLNIPEKGRAIIIANHPLGALDALSLILLIKQRRDDIKVVANELLMYIPQLKPILIPVDAMGGKSAKENIKNIYKALEEECIVLMFPSGEVSRVRPTGVKDTKWNKGFLSFSKKTNSPILPIFIQARNSSLFYFISMINKKISAYLLIDEMFKKKNSTIEFKIGEIIPYKNIATLPIKNDKQVANLFKKHLYKISKNKKGIIKTLSYIAPAEDKNELENELKNTTFLGKTSDGMIIYLFEYFENSAIIREIARLREITFRQVDEGTDGQNDLDEYDVYYKHIILWNEKEREIVGAYRLAECNYVLEKYGKKGFYTNTLFEYLDEFDEYLKDSLEMGRSFVVPKYWGSRALDYLWQGIGAYLYKNPHIKYLFGGVSMSAAYPKYAQDMIVDFYSYYFSPPKKLVKAKTPFITNSSHKFSHVSYKDDFKNIKQRLPFGLSIPTLYKQYSQLCEEDGMYFAAFNIDHSFNDCIDAFILVKIDKMKEQKKQRYITYM